MILCNTISKRDVVVLHQALVLKLLLEGGTPHLVRGTVAFAPLRSRQSKLRLFLAAFLRYFVEVVQILQLCVAILG